MKTKLISGFFILAVFFSLSLKAQRISGDNPKNVIKINVFALGLSNFSFQYERVLGQKYAVALGFSMMPSRNLPTLLSDLDSSKTLSKLKISDWSITPEFRWYPGTKQGAPHGFYLAPYLRYSNTDLTLPYEYTLSGMGSRTDNIEGNYTGFGGGLMMGAQWLIKQKFSIDWWILGGHYGSGSSSVSIAADYTSLSATQRAEVKAKLDKTELPVGKINSSITDTGAKINIDKLPYFGLRGGLTIGYAF